MNDGFCGVQAAAPAKQYVLQGTISGKFYRRGPHVYNEALLQGCTMEEAERFTSPEAALKAACDHTAVSAARGLPYSLHLRIVRIEETAPAQQKRTFVPTLYAAVGYVLGRKGGCLLGTGTLMAETLDAAVIFETECAALEALDSFARKFGSSAFAYRQDRNDPVGLWPVYLQRIAPVYTLTPVA